MSGNFLLDTAVLAVSLFNTMLLLWLGIVVVLGADRKRWGILLAGGGLLSGGIFFLTHTAIIARGLRAATFDLDVLWHFGWLPIIAAPLAWYFVMLWYAGILDARAAPSSPLRRIHLAGLAFNGACALMLFVLILFVGSLPTFKQVVTFGREGYVPTPGTPLLVVVYAVYNIACMALAIHALQHPEPSARWMGDLARVRAKPWLTGASLALLVVSMLVSALVLVLFFWLDAGWVTRENDLRQILAGFDALLGGLVAVAVILIGKAAVSYEIFTGKVLPRRGFLRQWRRAVILAAGYSLLIAATLTLPLSAVYALLLATLLLVTFYALVSVREFGERERVVRELRPFLQAHEMDAGEGGGRAAFDSLCENVLNVRVAYLCPRVPFASPLAFPPNAEPPCALVAALDAQFAAHALAAPVAPETYRGASWAIPLKSERGLLGVLLLGERLDNSLYTQEEMEIAQATGERVVQAQASAELTRRLIELQRGRMATTQVIDRRARRELHDEILPQLHTAMLSVSAGETRDALTQLQTVHRALSNLLREMPAGASPQIEKYGVIGALRRAVDDEFGGAFEGVTWEIEPRAESVARNLASLNAEVLYAAAREAVRNAAKHGRGGNKTRALHLCVRALWQDGLVLEIEDDGAGVLPAGNGTGQGLQLHSTMLAVIGGALTLERVGDKTRVRLVAPRSQT
ncbi:MAG: hypothetical protein HY741_19140 [Chloroflexi bacterium]|nr:hypothetical protein [Chloroflexota bacterium]